MLNPVQRYESFFRQLTPIFLFGVAIVALLGRWIPGADWVAKTLGPNFVLGFCCFILGLYVLLIWGETLRLHAMMSAVLKELLEFKGRQKGEGVSGVDAGKRAQRLEAARLLLPALGSPDIRVASAARKNLALLAGQDHGDAAEAWQSWIDAESRELHGR